MRMLCVGLLILCSSVLGKASIDNALAFEGVVLRIGPDPGYLSGSIPAYQLVKYHIERVITGRYEGKEIVVDHLILTGKELEGIKVGARVRVIVRASEKIGLRVNAIGIRKASQVVKVFYIGEEANLSKGRPVQTSSKLATFLASLDKVRSEMTTVTERK
jgi:hypothetical protein